MEPTDYAEQARAQYRMLGHQGLGWTEIRVLKKFKNFYVNTEEDYVKTVMAWRKNDVYVGVNPRRSNAGHGAMGTGMEADVSHVTAIVFDFDPIRPKDAPSTQEQHQEAIAEAGKLSRALSGVLSSSGSGAHVSIPIVPVEVSDVAGCAAALRDFAAPHQARFSTQTVRVDSTFDLPRIIRCWGTHNNKSDRECYFLSGEVNRRRLDLFPRQVCPIALGSGADSAGESKLLALSVRNGKIRDILNGRGNFVSRSECDFAFAAELLRSGLSIPETAGLLKHNKYGKAKERSERDLLREAERVHEKIKHTLPEGLAGMDLGAYQTDLSSRSRGIQTGFARWDSMTAGLKPSRFYVEAGRPTDGKTTRLVQMATNIAKQGKKVMYFPTEVPRSAIYDKMVSAESGVGLRQFQYGSFTDEERDSVMAAAKTISTLPVVIVEDFSLTLGKIRDCVQRACPDVVIVDFLQYMKYRDPNSSSEMAQNVAGIKKIGEECKIPVILASQLHRKPANIPDSLSDMKGTGSLEELGDVVTFIRTVDPLPYPAKSRLTIWKNKYGEPGTVDLDFHRQTCEFREC